MLWERVGLRVVEWVGARDGTCPSWHKPISIIIIHNFTILLSISTLLAQPKWTVNSCATIFIPLTKVASAHRSINYFRFFVCHYDRRGPSAIIIYEKLLEKVSDFLIGRQFKSVKFLLGHSVLC